MDAPIAWFDDVTSADWVAARLHPWLWLPDGFEAYCRIFHPVEPDSAGRVRRRWADVARENGRIAHSQMQFHLISRPVGTPAPAGYERGRGPRWGTLPLAERRAVVDLLHHQTSGAGGCWFCLWEGFGGLDSRGVTGRVELPGRSYLLYRGPIDMAVASGLPAPSDQSPNLWWPDDRTWFVSTEIDFAWTYVGGPAGLIDSIVRDERLEALPALLTDEPFYGADVLNESLDHG